MKKKIKKLKSNWSLSLKLKYRNIATRTCKPKQNMKTISRASLKTLPVKNQ